MNLRQLSRDTLGGFLIHLVLAASIIFILCLLYFYAYLPNTTNHGESVTVPSVEGMSFEKAVKFLEEHDLRFEINDSSYSSQYPPLTVLKQFPAAGAKVKENRKIYVSINRVNPPTVPMPDLVDGSLINADAMLRGNELKRGKIEFIPGPFLNLVKEMKTDGKTIVAGVRVPKGTVIDLVVMDGGSDSFPTPNIQGLPFDEAKFILLGSNLSVGNVTLLGDTTGMNAVVVKQKPEVNENIKVGDIVDLWVGKPDTGASDIQDEPLPDNEDQDAEN